MFITTVQKPNLNIELKAKKLAKELSYQYVSRGDDTLSQLKRKLKDNEILLVSNEDLKFVHSDSLILFFHPSMAKIRITSLLKSFRDKLLEVSGVQKGDIVVDCTMGLATDAIVFSFAVGKSGKVTTVESELVPYVLAREGLKNYRSGVGKLDEAIRRISVVHADHLEYMKSLPNKSVDIVYFDPMFRQPAKTVALAPLRGIANPLAIKSEAIAEAKRIARKTIIFKEHRNSGEFERLGFQLPNHKGINKFDYSVICCK